MKGEVGGCRLSARSKAEWTAAPPAPPALGAPGPERPAGPQAGRRPPSRHGLGASGAGEAFLEPGLHRGPLVGQDRVVDGVADEAVGDPQMPAQDALAHRAEALDRGLRAQIARIGLQGDPRRAQLVERVAELDLSYAPPVSTVWDPILIAAQEMLRELRR